MIHRDGSMECGIGNTAMGSVECGGIITALQKSKDP